MAIVSSRSPDPFGATWRDLRHARNVRRNQQIQYSRGSQDTVRECLRPLPEQPPSGRNALQLYELKLNFLMEVIQEISPRPSANEPIGTIGRSEVKDNPHATGAALGLQPIFGVPYLQYSELHTRRPRNRHSTAEAGPKESPLSQKPGAARASVSGSGRLL